MNSFLATIPDANEPVPRSLIKAAKGPVRLVWKNEVGGLTGTSVDIPGNQEPIFLKWNPLPSPESLVDEYWKLKWLQGIHPAPEPVDLIQKREYEILTTKALPGLSAVDPYWDDSPNTAIAAIANGLRQLHELPIDDCPYSWSAEERISEAIAHGTLDAKKVLGPGRFLSPPELDMLQPEKSSAQPEKSSAQPEKVWEPVEIDRLVICHGDPCAPNTLLDTEGNFLAHVDMGRLGIADRWADLAVATMSFDWNYSNYDKDIFWKVYGVEPDWPRIEYYRALWNAT